MPGESADMPVTVRLRLDLAYDGTDFAGWAIQPGRRTVAGELGRALQVLFREPVPLVVAGRTDAGVHATGQVAHVDVHPGALAALAPRHLAGEAGGPVTDVPVGSGDYAASPDDRPAREPPPGGGTGRLAGLAPGLIGLRRRLAGLLPPDVRARSASPAADGFDARFSALRRHYRYRISTADWGADPLRRTDTLSWRRPLDVTAMRAAATPLLGLHDFAAFCKPREGATTIRDLQRISVTAAPAGEPDLVLIDVTADAFCHSMVRSLVGVLLAVGGGRTDTDRPAALLTAARRTAEIAVAPAYGLTLVGVDYPPDAELAERAERTRAVRHRVAGCC
jgi:tRNA pseudouridine38-40 synthase